MPRLSSLPRIAVVFALALALAVCARPASAAPGAPAKAANPTGTGAVPDTSPSLRGFELLASVGWGASTTNTLQLELQPYGASFGFDTGYTWASGFRLGAYFSDTLGQSKPQHREPRVGSEDDFVADTSSVNGGLSVGWAVPVYAFVLRYSLSLGVTAMRWKIEDRVGTQAVSIGNGTSPTVGAHFAPGIALLWPYRWFEAGIGYEYLAQANGTIPSGFVAKLLLGVRL